MDLGTFNKRALLTGAGFSKNWRGLLATEFWAHLLGSPHLRDNQAIRSLLLTRFNFEEIYAIVQAGDYLEEDRRVMNEAIGAVLMHQEDLLNGAIIGRETEESICQGIVGVSQLLPNPSV